MDVLVCQWCGEIVLPFLKSPKIRKMTATSYVVDNFKCPVCEGAVFIKRHVRIEKGVDKSEDL